MISHCRFDFHFPHVSVGHSYVFFKKKLLFRCFCPYFSCDICFLLLSGLFVYLDISFLTAVWLTNNISHFIGCFFLLLMLLCLLMDFSPRDVTVYQIEIHPQVTQTAPNYRQKKVRKHLFSGNNINVTMDLRNQHIKLLDKH